MVITFLDHEEYMKPFFVTWLSIEKLAQIFQNPVYTGFLVEVNHYVGSERSSYWDQTSSVLLIYTGVTQSYFRVKWVKTTHYEIMEKDGPVPFIFPI